jgi:hypothetical protein
MKLMKYSQSQAEMYHIKMFFLLPLTKGILQ